MTNSDVEGTDVFSITLQHDTGSTYGTAGTFDVATAAGALTGKLYNGDDLEDKTGADATWMIDTDFGNLENSSIENGVLTWTGDDQADEIILTATLDNGTDYFTLTVNDLDTLKGAAVSAIGTANTAFSSLAGTSDTWTAWTDAKNDADEAIAAYVAAGGVANATNLTDAYTTFTTNSAVNGTDVYDITVGFNTPQNIDINAEVFNLDGKVYVTKFMYNGTNASALSEVTWTVTDAGASVNATINGTTVTWTKGEAESDTIILQASVADKTDNLSLGLETPQ